MVRGSITVLFSVCILASGTFVAGQGFQSSGIQVVGATNSIAAQLQQQYSRTQAWKRAYRLNPKSACSRGGGNTLCAAASTDAADVYLQLVAATSPWAYSSLDSSQAGTASLVAPPGDQQSCQTCSAFAVAAAAETAIASLLRVRAQDCSISVQALYFCGTPAKSCSAGWDLKSVIDQLQSRAKTLPTAKCLPYNPDFREEFLAGPNCSSSCSTTNPCTSQGTFGSEYISNMWVAQRWIRQFGSVVSQFDVYPDFKPFFEKPGNAKAVYKPKPGAKKLYGHAVVLVGYDNEKKYWLVKNSWGPLWADGGFFRVAYDTCSVLAPGSEAFGIRWTPNSRPKAIRLPVTPVEKNQTCYWYKTRQGDYLSRVAWEASVNLDQLMLDNVDRVKDPDVLVPGTKLLLCNPNPDSLLLPNGVMPKAEHQTDSSYNSDNAKCWEQVGDVTPCKDGYQPFCCDGDGTSATCLTANNEDTCTAQHGANFRFGWCKERGC